MYIHLIMALRLFLCRNRSSEYFGFANMFAQTVVVLRKSQLKRLLLASSNEYKKIDVYTFALLSGNNIYP